MNLNENKADYEGLSKALESMYVKMKHKLSLVMAECESLDFDNERLLRENELLKKKLAYSEAALQEAQAHLEELM